MSRVVHVLRQMNPGGIECWLDRLIRNWPRQSRPEFHLVLETEDFGDLAPALAAVGVHFHFCPPPSEPISMWAGFRKLLRQLAPVQVVHCHNHRAAFFPLSVAAHEEIPVRIAHSHADFRKQDGASGRLRRSYCALSKLAIASTANRWLAVSQPAALDLFGAGARKAAIAPCGTDFEPLLQVQRKADPSSFTLVHVGRLVPEKNHVFLFQLLHALLKVEARASLRLIGDGPLRNELRQMSVAMGLDRHIEFLGNRHDIPELLETADAFVFPSRSEGLGLAAIEAQGAGLPVLIASHLPKELDLIPSLCRRLALQLPIEAWVNSLLEIRSIPAMPAASRRAYVEASGLSIHSNVQFLEQIYAG